MGDVEGRSDGMTPAQVAWVVSLVVAGGLLPVGAIRMLAYRSGEIDHTPGLRSVARLALAAGAVAFVVWVALTIWFLTRGASPLGAGGNASEIQAATPAAATTAATTHASPCVEG